MLGGYLSISIPGQLPVCAGCGVHSEPLVSVLGTFVMIELAGGGISSSGFDGGTILLLLLLCKQCLVRILEERPSTSGESCLTMEKKEGNDGTYFTLRS